MRIVVFPVFFRLHCKSSCPSRLLASPSLANGGEMSRARPALLLGDEVAEGSPTTPLNEFQAAYWSFFSFSV